MLSVVWYDKKYGFQSDYIRGLHCIKQLFNFFNNIYIIQAAQEAGDIPRGWRSVTVKDAIKNLREIYTIHEELASDSDEGLFVCLQPEPS